MTFLLNLALMLAGAALSFAILGSSDEDRKRGD